MSEQQSASALAAAKPRSTSFIRVFFSEETEFGWLAVAVTSSDGTVNIV